MAHIQNTMIKKQLAKEAAAIEPDLIKYRKKVDEAKALGYDVPAIIVALQAERLRIKTDKQCGDSLFLHGVNNAQNACAEAIDQIISELKGDI